MIKKHGVAFTLVAVLILLITLPLVLLIQRQEQDPRSSASECSTTTVPADIMMVVDVSGSTNKFRQEQKDAMKAFVNKIAATGQDYRIGLIAHAGGVDLTSSLQNGADYQSLLQKIDTLPELDSASAGQREAIRLSNQQFSQFGRPGYRKVMIHLTDRANSLALDEAYAGYNSQGISTYIIAYDISNSTVRQRLQQLAATTGGTYAQFDSNNPESQNQAWDAAATSISCPSVTPVIPTLTPTPSSIPSVTLTPTRTPTPTTFPATITPTFTPTPTGEFCAAVITRARNTSTGECRDFPNACIPNGWVVEQCTIASSPTPTGSSQTSDVSLSLLLHGMGNAGDNVNPSNSTLSNKNPLHPTRDIRMEVFDLSNQHLLTIADEVTYNPQTGSFQGVIPVSLPSGQYILRVKPEGFLRRNIPGTQSLVVGQTRTLPPLQIINGDINNDNVLNIQDYNILLGCYSDLRPASACDEINKLRSDINDDGNVNQFDYNLFLRELSVQSGD